MQLPRYTKDGYYLPRIGDMWSWCCAGETLFGTVTKIVSDTVKPGNWQIELTGVFGGTYNAFYLATTRPEAKVRIIGSCIPSLRKKFHDYKKATQATS